MKVRKEERREGGSKKEKEAPSPERLPLCFVSFFFVTFKYNIKFSSSPKAPPSVGGLSSSISLNRF